MGGRTFVVTMVTVLLLAAPGAAVADTAADVEKANAFAMENFDLGDHAAARDGLKSSLEKLDEAGMASSPLAAQTRALLGLAHAVLGDEAAAKDEFRAAVRIAPDVSLDDRYATDAARALLDEARSAHVAATTIEVASSTTTRRGPDAPWAARAPSPP